MIWPKHVILFIAGALLIAFTTACNQTRKSSNPFYNRSGLPTGTGTSTGTGTTTTSGTNGSTSATAQGSSGSLQISVNRSGTSANISGTYRSSKGVTVQIQFSGLTASGSANTFSQQVGNEVSAIYAEAQCTAAGSSPCSTVLMSIYNVDYNATDGSQIVTNNFALSADNTGTRIQYFNQSSMYGYSYIDLVFVHGWYYDPQ